MNKYKVKLIDHLTNDIYCRLGVSKISGVGVIAIRDIPKGIDPFKSLSTYKDPIIVLKEEDLTGINKNVRSIIDDFFGNTDKNKKQKIYDMLASGPNNINIAFYMNHSDDPNMSMVEVKGKPYLEFIARRNIKEGEEITINYKEYEF